MKEQNAEKKNCSYAQNQPCEFIFQHVRIRSVKFEEKSEVQVTIRNLLGHQFFTIQPALFTTLNKPNIQRIQLRAGTFFLAVKQYHTNNSMK